MKIRDPKTIRRVAAALAVFSQAWVRLISYAYRPLTIYLSNDRPDLLDGKRYIFATWHEYVFIPTSLHSRPDTAWLIGQHADGELAAQVSERFGSKLIRGSSTRGGTAALLKILRDKTSTRHFGITTDGPKGPRRKFQFGAVYIASRTGLSIAPIGFGFSRCWRAKSWDRFAIPLPFSRVRCVSGHPFHVPPGLNSAELEPYRQAIEDHMNHITTIAEHWAATGKFDQLGYEPPADAPINPAHQKVWPSAWLVRRK